MGEVRGMRGKKEGKVVWPGMDGKQGKPVSPDHGRPALGCGQARHGPSPGEGGQNHTTPHCTAPIHPAPHRTTPYHAAQSESCSAAHCTVLHRTAPHCTTLHYTALHCTALHCTAPHCTALHRTALHLPASPPCPAPADHHRQAAVPLQPPLGFIVSQHIAVADHRHLVPGCHLLHLSPVCGLFVPLLHRPAGAAAAEVAM